MIIEIAPFDLVDGNRYIPADVVGRMYRDTVERDLASALPVIKPGSIDNDPWDPKVSVVLYEKAHGNLEGYRALITVRAGRGPAAGFTAASIGLARALFMVKDAAVEIIDLVDPPFEEWFPRPQEAAP
jgi:hypothetical protein